MSKLKNPDPGRLSHIQTVRLQADQGNFSPLAEVENIHVLAGALKLFFRELKEPLIPWDTVEKLLPIINLPNNQVFFFSILSLVLSLTQNTLKHSGFPKVSMSKLTHSTSRRSVRR